MEREVRYEMLRPQEIRQAREQCPVLYIPIGTLEWHGPHSPVGLDTIKAHHLCIRCAQADGGLVFPPLYYGESRTEGLMDCSAEWGDKIRDYCGLPAGQAHPGVMRWTGQQQHEYYLHLLLHVLCQGKMLGFQVLVLCAGHYPLLDFTAAACHLFHQQRDPDGVRNRCIPWCFTGYELVQDAIPGAGDHAAWWETSLMLHLAPGSIDRSQFPDRPDGWFGVGGARMPEDACEEDGARATALIVERVTREVRDRREHPEKYMGHGLPMETWRNGR
jgi:creatinine amidohydrolase